MQFYLLPDKKHDWIFGIKVREVLLDEKHNQTFRVKVREVLLDEKHNQTFELSVARQKYNWTFGIKCYQAKNTTGLLELGY
ncbi:hypothetical protein RclHR1_05680006 [Rhizophagus clarus]|uniref:Uncharacterized protein n=1 Tax=Rhizophagus clarus TaxID=94130 RepID=A0A2Z6RQ73_9GLOM|nr:hypothetical protein RclHR1_05680006 [Rhizophagus clarus]